MAMMIKENLIKRTIEQIYWQTIDELFLCWKKMKKKKENKICASGITDWKPHFTAYRQFVIPLWSLLRCFYLFFIFVFFFFVFYSINMPTSLLFRSSSLPCVHHFAFNVGYWSFAFCTRWHYSPYQRLLVLFALSFVIVLYLFLNYFLYCFSIDQLKWHTTKKTSRWRIKKTKKNSNISKCKNLCYSG